MIKVIIQKQETIGEFAKELNGIPDLIGAKF
jgi:hypothetical protein